MNQSRSLAVSPLKQNVPNYNSEQKIVADLKFRFTKSNMASHPMENKYMEIKNKVDPILNRLSKGPRKKSYVIEPKPKI